jgi:hypothetical protein
MQMVEWHERERQNFKNDWCYTDKSKIKQGPGFEAYYAASKANPANYAEPYLYKYKCIAID